MAQLTHKTTLLLSDEEYRLLKQETVAQKKTLGELIRLAIHQVYKKSNTNKKKKMWEKMFEAKAPVSDWPTMEEEIIKGRLS